MGFSRQECWSGVPFPSPGDLPNPGIKLGFPALQADTLPSEPDIYGYRQGFPGGSVVKNQSANAEDMVLSMGWEDSLE